MRGKSGNQGHTRAEGPEARSAWARWEALPEKGQVCNQPAISAVVYPKLKRHPVQAGYVTCPW